MDPSWSVLIRYTRDGESRRGSGLRVGGQFVLTADHCASGTNHRLVVSGHEYPATVHVRSNDQDVDLAILVADDLPAVEPLRCAMVNRGVVDKLVDCMALGFPSWKQNPHVDKQEPSKDKGSRPVLAQTTGDVPTAEGIDPWCKTVELLSFKITDPEAQGRTVPKGSLDQPTSIWAGMSGSGVLTPDDMLVGVIRSHTLAEGGRSLTVTPLDAINTLPTDVASAIWRALSVADRNHLPLVPMPRDVRPKSITPPSPVSEAVSRAILLEPVTSALLTDNASAVALVGPPGFGKTTIALQACQAPHVRARFKDMLFLTLGREPNLPDLLARAFTELTGVQPTATDEKVLARRVLTELAGRGGLLLLDDLWHPAPLEVLLSPDGRPPVLITTRDRSLVRDRATVVVVDLPLNVEEARTVLMRGRDLTSEETTAVDNLGHRLRGWPLLVSLAAAWLRWPGDDQISPLSGISEALRQLDEGGVTAFDPVFDVAGGPGSARAVAVTLHASLAAVPDDAREKFSGLAVFPPETALSTSLVAGHWQISTADAGRLLRGLADRSLLRYDGRQVWLHSVVHDYLYGQLLHPANAHRALLQRWGDPLLIEDRERLTQIAWQRARAGDGSWLDALISPRWFSHLLTTTGTPTAFFADAETAAHHAEHRGDKAAAVRCWLAIARMRERFAHMRPEICRTLAALDEVDRAVEYAALMNSLEGYNPQDPFVDVVRGCAARDPNRAAELARTRIRSPLDRCRSLTGIAVAVADTEPGLSRSLADEAVELARAESDSDPYGFALADAVAAVSMTDPTGGETLADVLGEQGEYVAPSSMAEMKQASRAKWLRHAVARGAVRRDPDRAERLIRSIDGGPDAYILALVSQSVAETMPDRARLLADEALAILEGTRSDYTSTLEGEARTAAVAALARVDLPRALGYVRTERDSGARALLLADLAQSLRDRDPARARALISEAIPLARKWLDNAQRMYRSRLRRESGYGPTNPEYELHGFIRPAASVDAAATLDLVRKLTDDSSRASALCEVAEGMFFSDRRVQALALVDEVLSQPSVTADPTSWGRHLLSVLRILAGVEIDQARQRVKVLDRKLPHLRRGAELALVFGLARVDVVKAVRLLERIGSYGGQEAADLAAEIGRREPDHAADLARSIGDPHSRKRALVAVGRAIASSNPRAAERFARNELGLADGAAVYADVGRALALRDPDGARRLADELLVTADATKSPDQRAQLRTAAGATLAGLDADHAVALAAEAEQGSYGFSGWSAGFDTSSPTAEVAAALADTDLNRAEQLADAVTTRFSSDNAGRRQALTAVAVIAVQTGEIHRALAIAQKASDIEGGWSQGPDPMRTVLSAVARNDPRTAYGQALNAASPLTRARLAASVAVAAAEAFDPLEGATPKYNASEALPDIVWPVVTQTFDAEPALLLTVASARWAMYNGDANYVGALFDDMLELTTKWS